MQEPITPTEYRAFQRAYDFFNRELFAGTLPHVLVTLQRHAGARGYFSPERFNGRTDRAKAHELALNPDGFTGRSDREVLPAVFWALSQSRLGRQDEGNRPAAIHHRSAGR
jgi:hypothetical protein